MKKRKSCFIWLLCILLLVTVLPSVDFTDVQAASVRNIYWGLTLQRINKKNEAFLKDP